LHIAPFVVFIIWVCILRAQNPPGFEHPAFSETGEPRRGLSGYENIAGNRSSLFIFFRSAILPEKFSGPIYIVGYLALYNA